MKKINFFGILLMAMLFGFAGVSNAQVHPLSFGIGGVNTSPNWYANYVGQRLEVVSPAAIAGNKDYTTANSGAGAAADWGGVVTTPLVNLPIFMDTTSDSFGCTAFSSAAASTMTMTPTIAVIWRGPIPVGACDFGCKALDAQNAGAVAIVIINEYPGQGPVGMAASTSCTGITIPVFMIGNLDGIAISSQYRSGVPVHMTITSWGQNLNNDLGFVPGGAALWHNYAVPSNQLGTSANPTAYNMLDGAFIANFGLNPAYGVAVKANTFFTPTGGSATSQHTSEVDLSVPFDNTNPTSDSIWAMFKTSEYALSASGTGRFDVQYTIQSDSVDQFPADNSTTASFYVTDSLYSKGRYDFTANAPTRSLYEGFNAGNEFIWGPMYYVAKAGTALSAVQYSIAKNYVAGDPTIAAGANNIYIFKWVDSLGGVADSVVEDGELELVGSAVKNYDVGDTTESTMYQSISTDGTVGGPQVPLMANTWYYVAIDVPSASGSTTQLFLGCDGVLNPYPRVFGRFHADAGLFDYSSIVIPNDSSTLGSNPTQGNPPTPGGMTAFINSVDSFVYSAMNGIIPSVAMIANNNPNAVKAVSKPFANVSLFPNPAKDEMKVTASFGQNEKTVSYEIIDGLARFVSKDIHTNVQNDIYTVNTAKLAAGNYYLIINAEGKITTKKFTVIK